MYMRYLPHRICVLSALLCLPLLLTSCGILDAPDIPYTPKDEPFGKAVDDSQAGVRAIQCLAGKLNGKKLEELSKYAPRHEQKNSDSTGKIYKVYLFEEDQQEDKYGHPTFLIQYEYTFTVHTTDDGTITRCRATTSGPKWYR